MAGPLRDDLFLSRTPLAIQGKGFDDLVVFVLHSIRVVPAQERTRPKNGITCSSAARSKKDLGRLGR